jgi:catechol-2,3-dioxygenase
MSTLPKSGAVIFAKDLPRLASFYAGVAGLSVVLSARELIVLESPHQQLVLHALPARIAQSLQISAPPKRRTDTAVKLVFAVASLAEARAHAAALGGELNPKDKEFEARGFRACDGHDPEGNVIQFRESAL